MIISNCDVKEQCMYKMDVNKNKEEFNKQQRPLKHDL